MELIQIVGIAAGICTSSSTVPQIVKTLNTKKAEDVSVFMFIVLIGGNGLWTWYGLSKSDVPILVTSFLAISLNVIMLVLRYKYRHSD